MTDLYLGVRFIDPAEIVRQRTLGWPDLHPEQFCHRCGGRNITSWFVESEAWNLATAGLDRGRGEILCPQCFTELHEAATSEWRTWELKATR